jgi:hypothetical protein
VIVAQATGLASPLCESVSEGGGCPHEVSVGSGVSWVQAAFVTTLAVHCRPVFNVISFIPTIQPSIHLHLISVSPH